MRKNIHRDTIINAIKECGGIISLTADKLGITRKALYERIEKSKQIKDALDEVRNRTGDAAENVILNAITTGVVYRQKTVTKGKGKNKTTETVVVPIPLLPKDQVKTAQWYAERILKGRGYTTRQEHTGKDGEELKNAVLVVNGKARNTPVIDESDIIED